MNSPILDAICLAHFPRWVELEDANGWITIICTNCGESKKIRRNKIPLICPNCKEKMGGAKNDAYRSKKDEQA